MRLPDDLVERVAREFCTVDGADPCEVVCGLCLHRAGMVVAVCMEKAAKVADGYHRIVETRRDMFDDGNITVTRGHTLADPRKIAAAIRNLIGEK